MILSITKASISPPTYVPNTSMPLARSSISNQVAGDSATWKVIQDAFAPSTKARDDSIQRLQSPQPQWARRYARTWRQVFKQLLYLNGRMDVCRNVKYANAMHILICVYVCININMYIYIHMCVFVYVWMCECLNVCTYVCLYVCVSVCLHVCVSVCLHVCVSACLYVYMYVGRYVGR